MRTFERRCVIYVAEMVCWYARGTFTYTIGPKPKPCAPGDEEVCLPCRARQWLRDNPEPGEQTALTP